jgi:peroxiredoxin family protein
LYQTLESDNRRLSIMSEDNKVKTQEEQIQDLLKRVASLEKAAPGDKLTLGVMSGNLDYTIAAFIIALGAVAYDMEVDMFFTFWGTTALRDPKKSAKKGFLDKMFGWMLPKGSGKLPISKMQMGGIGPEMIKYVMKNKGAKSLETLMADAADFGVKIHVCEMSMDIMGLKKEEMMDYPHLDYVGVGTFIGFVGESKATWFM